MKTKKRKRYFRSAVLVVIVSQVSAVFTYSQVWNTRAPIPTERWNPASVAVDGTIYVIGGQEGIRPYVALPSVEAYDPAADGWQGKAPMLTARWGVVAEVVDDKIYAIGGRGGSFEGGHYPVGAVEEYDPATDSWATKTPMPTPRGWAGGAVIGDTIYVFGGRGAQGEEVVVEKYHPATDSWTTGSPMPQPRATSFVTASVNDKVYLIGGWGSNVVQEYDPLTHVWTTKHPMPTVRGGSGIGVVHGRIYVVGGRGGNSNECESYDPVHDRWTSWTPLPTRREGLAATVVNDKLYAMSGSVPLAEGGLPYLTTNEEGSHFVQPVLTFDHYVIDDSQGNNNGAFNTGESIELTVFLENIGYTCSGISAELLIDDEYVIVIEPNAVYESLEPFQPTGNTDCSFRLGSSPDFEAHWTSAALCLSTDGGYEDTLTFDVPVGDASILVMDDDGGVSYEDCYHACLYSMGEVYTLWELKSRGCPCFDISEYETVIWFTGDERDSSLTHDEQALLTHYLDGGGHVVLSGQNIGYDLVAHGSQEDSLFYTNALHAKYIGDSTQETFLNGLEGDPISGECTFLPIDENQLSPSIIAPHQGASPVLVYFPSGDVAAIKYEGEYKLVYVALGFEGIGAMGGNDLEVRTKLLDNIFRWFNYEPVDADVNQDGVVNILDVIMAVNIVLSVIEPSPPQRQAADCNADGIVNILDVVGIVNVVLGTGACPPG